MVSIIGLSLQRKLSIGATTVLTYSLTISDEEINHRGSSNLEFKELTAVVSVRGRNASVVICTPEGCRASLSDETNKYVCSRMQQIGLIHTMSYGHQVVLLLTGGIALMTLSALHGN